MEFYQIMIWQGDVSKGGSAGATLPLRGFKWRYGTRSLNMARFPKLSGAWVAP